MRFKCKSVYLHNNFCNLWKPVTHVSLGSPSFQPTVAYEGLRPHFDGARELHNIMSIEKRGPFGNTSE